MNKVLFSHKSDDWATPDWLYWWFVHERKYYDPCPLHADFDGLLIEWPKDRNVFINPPFSNIMPFVDKGIRYYCKGLGSYVCFLLPVRTDSKWFKRLYEFGCRVTFFPYRLHFSESKGNAPFPCMLVHLDSTRNPHLAGGGVFNVDDFESVKKRFYEWRNKYELRN